MILPGPFDHVLIRVRSEDGRTVASHQQIINQHGRAMFAKLGKGLGREFTKQLNGQIHQSISTYLFLAVHKTWSTPFSIFQCNLISVKAKVNAEQLNLIPEHVQPFITNTTTWFEIGDIKQMPEDQLDRIYIKTSGRCVLEALRGTTAIFRVGLSISNPVT